ncbi:MAG TPA: hypothetical protein VHC94_20015 [Nitrobacter sp.]|nr:hypothetical protein [Nitrobacter sp.]
MFKHLHFFQTSTPEQRFADDARQLREQAGHLPPGQERENLLREIGHRETASHLAEWVNSPGLRTPT